MSYFLQQTGRRGLRGFGDILTIGDMPTGSCGPDQILDLASGGCIPRPTGCGLGFHLDPATGLCILDGAKAGTQPPATGCKPGWRPRPQGGCAVICKPGLVNDASGRYCLDPSGTKPTVAGCPQGAFPLADGCYVCPPGAQWDGTTGCDCLPGMVYDASRTACVPGNTLGQGVLLPQGACPPGTKPDPFTGAFCVPDPGAIQGTVPVPTQGCPPGTMTTAEGCRSAVIPPVPAPAMSASALLSNPLFWLAVTLAGAAAVAVMHQKSAAY